MAMANVSADDLGVARWMLLPKLPATLEGVDEIIWWIATRIERTG